MSEMTMTMTMTMTGHPDAALLVACVRFEALEAEYRRNCDDETDFNETGGRLPEGYREAAETIAALRAIKPEGKKAKAHAIWAFYQPDPPTEDLAGALWSLLCDVAEVTP